MADFIGVAIRNGREPAPMRDATGAFTPDYRSIVQFWNPADSEVAIDVHSYNATWMVAGTVDATTGQYVGYQKCQKAVGVDVRFYDTMLLGLLGTGYEKTTHLPSKAEFRTEYMLGVNIPGAPSSKLFAEFWLGEPRKTSFFPFCSPIKLAPGQGLIICPDQPSTYNIAGFEWSETSCGATP